MSRSMYLNTLLNINLRIIKMTDVNNNNNELCKYVTITPFFCTLVSTSVRNIRHHITKASVGSAEMCQVLNSTVLKNHYRRLS